jgi:lycopene cyclase domain-containing protein
MTYAGLAGLFLAGSAALLVVAAVLRRPDRAWWRATAATAIAMLGLTAVFDNVMIGADLFRFDDGQLSGVMVGLAPIEDFAWPLAAVTALPALLLLIAGPRRRDERARTR